MGNSSSLPFATPSLEEYFEFYSPDDIRIKGHRIGIDTVLHYYLNGYRPEEILVELDTLTLEKIYATITFYLRNRTQVDAYLFRLQQWRQDAYQKRLTQASSVVQRLRAIQSSHPVASL